MNLIYKTKNKSCPPAEKLEQVQCRNLCYLALLITFHMSFHTQSKVFKAIWNLQLATT